MSNHGVSASKKTEQGAQGASSGGHVGFGDKASNKEWLLSLAAAMEDQYWPELNDQNKNEEVPAGYTYLGQLIAHDISSHVSRSHDQAVDPKKKHIEISPLNGLGLTLHTVYGDSSLPYAPNENEGDNYRTHFRLGSIRTLNIDNMGVHEEKTPDTKKHGLNLDVARVGCPYSDKTGLTDVLISDHRNDDNIIISQFTMFFQTLHNKMFDKMVKILELRGELDKYSLYEQSQLARKIVALVYRKIIVNDYLRLTLNENIYRCYNKRTFVCTENIDYKNGGEDVTPEFSLAAFRFGHAVIRGSYVISNALQAAKPQGAGIKEILRHNSEHGPEEFPLKEDWIVQWEHFFNLNSAIRPQPSFKIGPSYRTAFFNDQKLSFLEERKAANIAEIDLLRAMDGNIRSVKDLIAGLPEALKSLSPILDVVSSGGMAAQIQSWIDKLQPAHRQRIYAADEIDENGVGFVNTKTDLPPLLFFLLEAAVTGNSESEKGRRLGVLGSAIVADTIFRVLRRGHDVIEGDDDVVDLSSEIFPVSEIREVSDLIKWVWPQN